MTHLQYAKPDDNSGAAASTRKYHMVKTLLAALLAVTCVGAIAADVAPTVSLTAPANNAAYAALGVADFAASAADSDGSIGKVDFNNAVTARSSGSSGTAAVPSRAKLAIANSVAPAVSLAATPSNSAAPAVIAISATATAGDSDGSIAKVEFFNGATLLTTVTQAPYIYNWSGVAAGTYALTAQATDNLGNATTTAVTSVTVTQGAAQAYYIYSDQINTAREITDAAGVKVWQADPEPFGANLPNENPIHRT